MGSLILGSVVGIFLILAFGVLGGLSIGYWGGIFLIVFSFTLFALKNKTIAKRTSRGEKWKAQFPAASYSYSYADNGIAIDLESSKIHLLETGKYKEYPLSAVRSWRTSHLSGGETMLVGNSAINAVAVMAANAKQAKANINGTGLFVSVRDVDHPEWRIKFADNDVEEKKQQNRWHEILNQVVNER